MTKRANCFLGLAKEQLHDGKTEVRSILGGEAIIVTDAEIEESLWHYYYDVDKTVNYLRSTWSLFFVRSIEVLTHERASSRSEKSPAQEIEKDEGSGSKICKR